MKKLPLMLQQVGHDCEEPPPLKTFIGKVLNRPSWCPGNVAKLPVKVPIDCKGR
jgi:hypothetical protein